MNEAWEKTAFGKEVKPKRFIMGERREMKPVKYPTPRVPFDAERADAATRPKIRGKHAFSPPP